MTNVAKEVGLLGFGEAGLAFTSGWRQQEPDLIVHAFDIKTVGPEAASKRSEYLQNSVHGCDDITGLAGLPIFSLVTADQAHAAAQAAASHIADRAFFFDCNSCAPQTKANSAKQIESANGRYVDVAIMAPVYPKLHKSPLLVSGPHAKDALVFLEQLGMDAKIVLGDVGAASSVKMVRSILMKGLEAVMMECVLAGRAAGVDERVLDSLDVTYPGFDWHRQAAHMMERATTHGVRRAAEMREVAKTVELLGLPSNMSSATVGWMEIAAGSGLGGADPSLDYAEISEKLLASTRGPITTRKI